MSPPGQSFESDDVTVALSSTSDERVMPAPVLGERG